MAIPNKADFKVISKYTDKIKFRNIPFRKGQLVAFSEMEGSVFETKSFQLQYDSFQIGYETSLFGNEMCCFISLDFLLTAVYGSNYRYLDTFIKYYPPFGAVIFQRCQRT